MAIDVITLAMANTYTAESLEGQGALKGDSAYEVAVENGFEGTEEEWLESLKGLYVPEGGEIGQILRLAEENKLRWDNEDGTEKVTNSSLSQSYKCTIELTEECPDDLTIYVSGEEIRANVWRTVNSGTISRQKQFNSGWYINPKTFCSVGSPAIEFSGNFNITYDIVYMFDKEPSDPPTDLLYKTFIIGLFKAAERTDGGTNSSVGSLEPLEGDGQIYIRGDRYAFSSEEAGRYVASISYPGGTMDALNKARDYGGHARVIVDRTDNIITVDIEIVKTGGVTTKTNLTPQHVMQTIKYYTPNSSATNYALDVALESKIQQDVIYFPNQSLMLTRDKLVTQPYNIKQTIFAYGRVDGIGRFKELIYSGCAVPRKLVCDKLLNGYSTHITVKANTDVHALNGHNQHIKLSVLDDTSPADTSAYTEYIITKILGHKQISNIANATMYNIRTGEMWSNVNLPNLDMKIAVIDAHTYELVFDMTANSTNLNENISNITVEFPADVEIVSAVVKNESGGNAYIYL